MKKQIFPMIAAAALFLTGCNSVDLSPLEKRIAELEGKVNAIEKSVSDLNSNASGIKTTVDALKQKLTVVSVEEVSDGYKITFSDGKEAVIKDGAAGAAGAAGPQGPEGPQGPAGTAPTIGVSEVEGVLVWTVNGEAVKDKDGKVIPVSSTPKAPEFKYEKGVWYYRVGEGEWTACSEGEASAIEVIELDDVVLITIGDTVITLPKESVSAPIESIATVFKVKANRLFVPVGKTIDLKEWFTVAPEGALKTMVDYTFFKTVNDQEIDLEGDELAAVPLAIDSKGVLTASGSGPYSIRISSKLDKTIKTNIFIRAGECPDDVVPAVSIDPKERIDIFKGSFEEYNKMTNFSGTASWNPFNNSLAGVFNGNWNFRVGMPVTPNANITMANGHLHLLFYVPDVSYLKPNDDPLFELTSGGANDVDEINWKVSQFATGLKNGWNEVDLKLSDAAAGPGKFDPSKANFFRIVINAQTPDGSYHPFQFRDVFVYAAEPDPTVITSQADIDALHGEGLTVPGLIVRGSGVTDQVWANIKTKIAVVDGPMLAEDAAFTMGTLFFKDVQCKGDITLRNICTGAGQFFNSDDFPKHVYGNLTIENVNIHGWAGAGFNLVTEIDGNLTIKTAMMGNNTCFTTLQKVGGDVTIDGPQADFNGNRIWNVDQWTIKQIGGKLSILNSKIVNLAGFSNITAIGGVYIKGNPDFNDFTQVQAWINNGILTKDKAECYNGADQRVSF